MGQNRSKIISPTQFYEEGINRVRILISFAGFSFLHPLPLFSPGTSRHFSFSAFFLSSPQIREPSACSYWHVPVATRVLGRRMPWPADADRWVRNARPEAWVMMLSPGAMSAVRLPPPGGWHALASGAGPWRCRGDRAEARPHASDIGPGKRRWLSRARRVWPSAAARVSVVDTVLPIVL